MITNYLISAVILGFVVAIPPGAVTIIAGQRALQFGFKNSLYFSLGSGVSDVFYIILVYTGVAQVFSTGKYFKLILWVICGSLLVTLGILSILDTLKNKNNKNINQSLSTGFGATFLSGILITLTNPMTIVGWLAIAGNFFLIWNEKLPGSRNYGVITIMLIMAGVYLWFIPVMYFISTLRKVFSNKIKKALIIISGICLILFGASSFYYAFIGTFR